MVANIESLIRRVDEDRVVGEVLIFKRFTEARQVLVNALDSAEVVFSIALELPTDEITTGEFGFAERFILGVVSGAPSF